MAGIDNLKPFQPGNTFGKGRPKGSRNLTKLIEEALEREITIKGETKPTSEWLIASLFRDALKGDNIARNQIFDRIEGKPLQRNEHTGSDGGPITQVSYTTEVAKARLKQIIEDK